MDVNKLIEDTTAAMMAKERGKYGRTATIERDGVTCTVSEDRDRFGRTKIRSQLKKDGKVVSKASLQGETFKGMNEALRAAFEAQAPQLAADYESIVRSTFERFEQTFKGRIPAGAYAATRPDEPGTGTGVERWQAHVIANTLLPNAKAEEVVTGREQYGRKVTMRVIHLDEQRMRENAQRYGDEVAVQWFYKTNEKLGAIESPELLLDRGGNVVVTGTRAGKAIRMEQQRTFNVSPLGTPFHQFPARIYVDGKFTPEAAYKKAFLA